MKLSTHQIRPRKLPQYLLVTVGAIVLALLLLLASYLTISIWPGSKSLPWDLIVGLTATLLALLALVVTVWEGIVMRRHNRLSVRPMLDFKLLLAAYSPDFGLTLLNKGVGPAIITKFDLFVDGQPIAKDGTGGWISALCAIGQQKKKWRYGWWEVGQLMEAGEKLEVLGRFGREPRNDQQLEDERNSLRLALGRINILIEYTSVYGADDEVRRLDMRQVYPYEIQFDKYAEE